MDQIYWYSLVPELETFFQNSLEELQSKLKERYPQLPGLGFERVSDEEVQYLNRDETYQRGGFLDAPSPNPLHAKRLVVMCRGDEAFAQDAQSQNGTALWGAAQTGDYALIWKPDNKYIIWHETLHVLYAEDSYDAHGHTTCEEKYCIMQYVPTEEHCGGDLFICENNVALLKANGW